MPRLCPAQRKTSIHIVFRFQIEVAEEEEEEAVEADAHSCPADAETLCALCLARLSRVVDAAASSATAAVPDIITSEPIVDRKSTFQGHFARVHTRAEVNAVMGKLYSDKRIARATHNIMVRFGPGTCTGSLLDDCVRLGRHIAFVTPAALCCKTMTTTARTLREAGLHTSWRQ